MTEKNTQEYGALREELLTSQKITNTIVLGTTTASASLFIVGTQTENSTVAGFAFLMPQIFVIITLAQIHRKSMLLERLACYIAVFHDMPNGGWELYSRFPFSSAEMNERGTNLKWRMPKGLYTTYGFLLAILLTSAGLLIASKYFCPWGIIGSILPLLTISIYLYFNYKNKGWQRKCLISWNNLKKMEEEKSTDWIYKTILNEE